MFPGLRDLLAFFAKDTIATGKILIKDMNS